VNYGRQPKNSSGYDNLRHPRHQLVFNVNNNFINTFLYNTPFTFENWEIGADPFADPGIPELP